MPQMKISIPDVTDERLVELASLIKPIEQRSEPHRFIAVPELTQHALRRTSFIWDPTYEEGKVPELRELRRIKTYHTFAYYGLFKPTIAECLAQIPPGLVNDVVAFSIGNDLPNFNSDEAREAFRNGYHLATTILYGSA